MQIKQKFWKIYLRKNIKYKFFKAKRHDIKFDLSNFFVITHKIVIKPAYINDKVSDYFSNKSKCLEVFKANVIYKYTCSVDQSIYYIGEKPRQFSDELKT